MATTIPEQPEAVFGIGTLSESQITIPVISQESNTITEKPSEIVTEIVTGQQQVVVFGLSAPSTSNFDVEEQSHQTHDERVSRANTQSKLEIALTIEQLVANSRAPPLTRDAFIQFLRQRYADEQFEFLVSVHRFKEMIIEQQTTQPQTIIQTQTTTQQAQAQDADKTRARDEMVQKAVDDIVNLYIKAGSEKQVNISEELREETLNLAAHRKHDNTSVIFDRAFKEVMVLLRDAGHLPAFIEASKANITVSNRNFRVVGSIILFTLSILAAAMMITTGVNRWYRLFLFLPILGAWLYVWSARCRICSALARRGIRMYGTDWGRDKEETQPLTQSKSKSKTLQSQSTSTSSSQIDIQICEANSCSTTTTLAAVHGEMNETVAGAPLNVSRRGSVTLSVSWLETLRKGTKAQRVLDKELQQAVLKTARRNVLASLLLSIAFTAAAIAIPPYNTWNA